MSQANGTTTHQRTPSSNNVFAVTTALLILLAVPLWVTVLWLHRPVPVPEPALYVLALMLVAFAAGEMFPLHFEVRSEKLMVSLSELPLVLGVLLMPPWAVGATYGAGALVAFIVRGGRRWAVLLNLALIAVESGLAFLVAALFNRHIPFAGILHAVQPRLLPVAIGVLAGAVLSACAVAVARRLSGVVESSARVVTRSALIAALIVGLTLAGFTVWTAIPAGPVLCLALLGGSVVLYRSYFTFLQQHAGLAGLYSFGASVAKAEVDIDTWQALARSVREQLDVHTAVLYLTDWPGGPIVLAAGPDGPLEMASSEIGDPILELARRDGSVVVSLDRAGAGAPDEGVRQALVARGATDAMAVMLRAGGRARGYICVWDARSWWRRMGDDDLQLLQTLAGHLATALDNHGLMASLQYTAYHDSVTGLVNRSGLAVRGMELSAMGARPGVLLLELDVLSEVTSVLGHDHGEQLVMIVSGRLTDAAGKGRVIGRVDADRFAILLATDDEDEALAFAERMLAAAGEPIVVDGVEVEPNVVAGIAFSDPSVGSADSQNVVLQRAQLALTSAKSKDEKVAIFRPAIGEVYHRRFQLVSQFRHAVDHGQVSVYYQPKLTLVDRELIGVEALVRWMHPEYGFVSPAELIEAIEPTSAIDVLFRHVLDQSLAQIAGWLSRGMRIPVAVNLSVRNLLAANLVQTIVNGLASHQVPSDLLILEVTESSVMNQPERSLPILQELHAMGIRLSVDDFGTGYSSLAYLRRLPIDELKIDKSFVQGMMTDLGDLAIVRAIIDLGHSLGMRVIAEGVEEEAARDALRSMRCDAMQGFLLSRPLPIDRFESWLTSRTMTSEDIVSDKPSTLRLRV
ncbi:MAG: EAL domain-containing protein [Nakamurella sp.]